MSNSRRGSNRATQGNPASSQTTNNQPEHNQLGQISRFSLWTSSSESSNQPEHNQLGQISRFSLWTSSSESSNQPEHNQLEQISRFSPWTSTQTANAAEGSIDEQTVDNVATTHDPAESNTTNITVPDSVERDRQQTLAILEGRLRISASRVLYEGSADEQTVDNATATHGTAESNTANTTVPDDVKEQRNITFDALEGRRQRT
ncbi:hypothetical protein ACJ73_01708 [Blastomyces percursus]|uniref:Uncharacterized protein n=1 Tax=Blastomyces percursus TaxID=1658174 RepID=A0A1J9QEF9_9EURO|nr:hypothetical protein ACJ73_01708 [Blastomyces percursus]